MTADLRQIIAKARQLLLDGEVEDALEILHADDAAPSESVPVTRYEREILVAEIERLTLQLARADFIAANLQRERDEAERHFANKLVEAHAERDEARRSYCKAADERNAAERERDDLIEHCDMLDQQMAAKWPVRTADHFDTSDALRKWADDPEGMR